MTSQSKIELILIDDDPIDLKVLEIFCAKSGYSFSSFNDPSLAIKYALKTTIPYLIISDISMPRISGFDVLESIKSKLGSSPVIFISGSSSIDNSIKAMRKGALDFLIKPVSFNVFQIRVQKAIDRLLEQEELLLLQDSVYRGKIIDNFVGTSSTIKDVYQTVAKVAPYDSPILISGENGVGKENIAKSIHEKSNRHEKPFLTVNCSSIPASLIDTELFGQKKDNFNDAEFDKKGIIEKSSGGILLLNEINAIPQHTQSKLLKVLTDKTVNSVGSNLQTKVDLRVICTTSKNINELVKKGTFREDLYYRINVIPIHILPLRERKEDLKTLIPYLLNKNYRKWGLKKTISDNTVTSLLDYDWPGNVRELENAIERAYVLSSSGKIEFENFRIDIEKSSSHNLINTNLENIERLPSLKELEQDYIRKVLKICKTKMEAAKVLGIGRKTLYRKEELL